MSYWLSVYALITILVFLSTGAVIFAGIAAQRITGLISRAIHTRPYNAPLVREFIRREQALGTRNPPYLALTE
jgi:hypothetical protein